MKQITTKEFESEVLGSQVPVLVDFHTPSCGPCLALKPVLEEIEAERAGTLKLVQVDASASPELAADHRVSAVPALFLYRNRQCIGQRAGLTSKRELVRWLDGLGAEPAGTRLH
ncbi:MAG: thioredoxin family protein [Verrucomicrobia bacterium]|jgi:thioredoxin 1|nr:thioredoxin family protein [Verrucomicrobiota bacterium]